MTQEEASATCGSLDRAKLIELLDELAEALKRKQVRGHVSIVGGAVKTLAFLRNRSTRDVDAGIEERNGAVMEAAGAIGRKHGVGESWLNEQATHYMPKARDRRAQTLYDSPYLVATGASPAHMLAMKLEAGRDTDQEDVARLVEVLNVTTPCQGLAIHSSLFPGSRQHERAEALLKTALRDMKTHRARHEIAPWTEHSPAHIS